jgi:hypothetical protein
MYRNITYTVIALFVGAITVLMLMSVRRRQYNIARYETYISFAYGQSKREVIKRFGEPTTYESGPTYYWDTEPMSVEITNHIANSIEYIDNRLGIGIIYRFSFDANDLLIGKHRYD